MSSRIEKYEIAGLIGEGGFGRVYKAQDTQMMRWVAIKVMTVEQNPTAMQRFRNEAIVAGGLNHPNLVTVYELGEFQGHPFIVMEYLEGHDLAHYIGPTAEQLPLVQKIDILVQAARGLERAHRQKVIHRDIKPANVMLLKDGSVKVMDFGIARLTHESNHRNTATGMVVGSLLWMAPEVFTGREADVQTDIWAYGVTAFELLAGEHPYQPDKLVAGGNTAQLIFQITQSEAPLLATRAPEVPLNLSEVVRRCMARDRVDRYQSLRDVVLDLEPILTQQRRQQSAILAAQADQAASLGQMDRAMDLVTEALEFDNESQAARALRERLQYEMRRRSVRDRVDALIQQSSDEVAARRLESAIQKLQSALDLDPENRIAASRKAELTVLLERKRQVDQIAAQASAALNSGNLEGTGRLLEQAFAIEPNNSQLIQIQQLLVGERLRRDKKQRFESGLAQAKEKLDQRRPNEALRILTAARDLASGEPSLDSLLFELEELRRESERMESIRQTSLKAQKLKEKKDWSGIVALLEPLSAGEGVAWPEITDLLALAHREDAARKRSEAIQKLLDEAKAHFKKGNLQAALTTAERAAVLYPDETRFADLTRRLSEERQRRDAEDLSKRLREEVKTLVRDRRHSEALRKIDGAAASYPEGDWAEPRRLASLEYARSLQQSGDATGAIRVLDTALEQIERDDALLRLRAEILAARESKQRHDAVVESVTRARNLLDSGELDTALGQIDSALAAHPGEAVLVNLRAQTAERMRTREFDRKKRDLDARLSQVDTSIALQNWDRASELLRDVEKEFPGNAESASLRTKLGEAQRRQRMLMARTGVESAARLKDWDRAAQLLLAFQKAFPDAPKSHDLERQIEEGRRASSLRDGQRAVEEAIANRDWPAASGRLASLRQDYPGEDTVVQLGKRYEEEAQLDRVVLQSKNLIQQGNWAGAQAEISKGLRIRRTPLLEDLLAQVEAKVRDSAPDPRLHHAPATAPPPPAAVQAPPASGKGMLYAVTGAVLLAAAVGGYFALRKTPEAAPLTASGPARIEGLVGARVSGQLRAAGGAAPYRWTIAGLPEGLRISEVTGEIEGIPAKDGVFSAEATVTDGEGKSAAVRVEIALTRPAAVPVIETPPPVVTRQEPPPVNKPKEKPKEIAAVPVPKPPPPVVTEAPKVVPEKPAETPAAEAEVARRGTMFWNGSLANGAVVTIEGNAASSGSLRGLPVPARIPVRIAVQSPNGVTVARQPDGGSNSFQLRNESGDAVSRIQFVWTRR